MKDSLTYRELYEVVNNRFDKLEALFNKRMDASDKMFFDFHKTEFEPLVAWKDNLVGKLAVIGGVVVLVVSVIVNAAWDLLHDALVKKI